MTPRPGDHAAVRKKGSMTDSKVDMRNVMHPDSVRAHIRSAIRDSSQRQLAADWHISESYLSDVMKGRREPGKKILDALRMERVVVYRFKEKWR